MVKIDYTIQHLEKLFPMSLEVNKSGCVQFSSKVFNEKTSCHNSGRLFDELFCLKYNHDFKFSYVFFELNEGNDYVFVGKFDDKEYCFTIIKNENKNCLFFAARNLYKALSESEKQVEYYKSLASFPEENPNPVLMLSYDGEVIYENKTSRGIFQDFTALMTEHEEMNRAFKKVVTEKGSLKVEFTYKDRTYTAQIVALKERNFINIFINDLTQEKKNFSMMQEERAQKIMVAKLSTLGEMASGVAHEINNPLTIVMGKTELVKKILQNSDLNTAKPDLNKAIDVIINATKRIAYIVKGLRNFSRDGNNDPFDKVKVEQIVEDVLMLTSERLKKANVILQVDYTPGIEFECRSVQIEQVIINLINNSFDAIENQTDKWVKLKIYVEDVKVVFEIKDSGLGISEALQEKILNPFFTTKEVGKGTGLGLSISVGLVESHGGRLYYNKGSKNTSFLFEFPRFQKD